MCANEETPVEQLHKQLISQGVSLSKSTVLHSRQSSGWTVRGSAYYQMICEVNKAKRLEWATKFLPDVEKGFLNVIFTDETSIQIQSHRQFWCQKEGKALKHKPQYL